MSDQTVSLLIEALVDQAGAARESMLEARHMRTLAETRIPAPPDPNDVSVRVTAEAINLGWYPCDGDPLAHLMKKFRAARAASTPPAPSPTIARVYLVQMEMRMRKAAQVLKRGRNAELSRDLLESAKGVAMFLRDTRGKK